MASRADDASAPPRPRTPWRDNLEAMAMAVVMAMLLKGFVVEAYKIPSGSMQPTLIGDDAMDVHDRILADKLSLTFRDPRRFEVVVFRFPLDRSKAFVKRVVGVGPEQFRIHHGDLWRRDGPDAPWEILRRPRGAQASAWKDVEPFVADRPAWTLVDAERDWGFTQDDGSGTDVDADGEGSARWRPELGTVRDRYWDGYDDELLGLLERRRERGGLHAVGDLRLEATVRARPGTEAVELVLEENDLVYRFVLPGPAAAADARARIDVEPMRGRLDAVPAGAVLERPWRLAAGEDVRVAAQNLDDLLELQLDGAWVLAAEVPGVATARSGARLVVAGDGADLRDVRLLRDTYYTAGSTHQPFWTIPDGHFFMLGDNTQDSSDSREWSYERYAVDVERLHAPAAYRAEAEPEPGAEAPRDGEVVLRANARRDENPLTYGYGLEQGPRLRLRDEWGELHDVPADAARRMSPVDAPFVPRELLLGRALAIFWPLDPRRGVYRYGWIR